MLRYLVTTVLCAGVLGCALDREPLRAAPELGPSGDSSPPSMASMDAADDATAQESMDDSMDDSTSDDDPARGAAGAAASPPMQQDEPSVGTPSCEAQIVTFREDVQPILRSRCTDCHDDSGAASLDLRSHDAVVAGGDSGPAVIAGDCEGSLLWRKTGAEPPFGSRMPADGPPWLSDAERSLICDWIAGGAVEARPPCEDPTTDRPTTQQDDETAPRFEGLDKVEELAGGCRLEWASARDDVTPPEAIVYEIHLTLDGLPFDLTTPHSTTEPGARSFEVELPPGIDYSFLVFAVDSAGNRDDNDRERECSLR